ncbi:hypothetical protein DL96DRAFT_1509396 [Flagelloscypha sp. PMI_526]|nr:hypothetical protein DL96DRAFT_1509396 [Flagelloscypha sp. PMI_526]
MHYMWKAIVFSSLAAFVTAQDNEKPKVPLSKKKFEYNNLPYKVDTDVGLVRGEQAGYNICNSTTQNQDSLCQTAIVNSIDDFCIWSAQKPNSVIGDIEGEAVAYCTKPDHGTRLFPAGSIKGLQFTKTPDYIQIVGFIDQAQINLQKDDFGGEMDPHGADTRGNPMGGLVFSNSWNGSYKQAIEWHNFVGSNYFCMKACDPAGPNAAHFCEHIYDRIGCEYNAPSHAKEGEYTSCDGDNQLYPGVYVENGATLTYQQPPESLGVIGAMPYTAAVPSSSNCQTFQSTQILTALPAPTGNATASANSTVAASTTAPATAGATSAASSASSSSNGASGSGVSFLVTGGVVLFGIAIGSSQIL